LRGFYRSSVNAWQFTMASDGHGGTVIGDLPLQGWGAAIAQLVVSQMNPSPRYGKSAKSARW
jgi:hypothetical protein